MKAKRVRLSQKVVAEMRSNLENQIESLTRQEKIFVLEQLQVREQLQEKINENETLRQEVLRLGRNLDICIRENESLLQSLERSNIVLSKLDKETSLWRGQALRFNQEDRKSVV